MSTPVVSVLLPVRNAAPYLDGCFESLIRQTLVDFEVVAVDDGSTDDSGRLLEGWAARDSRIRVLREPACGLVPTLEIGLAVCRGEFVARMDSDDICHPRRLELQSAFLASHLEVGVVSCEVRHYPRSGVGEGFAVYERWLNSLRTHEDMARERFVEAPLAHPSVMIRREQLLAIGGYRDRGWPEDYDLWLRLFEAGTRFEKIDRPLFFWREHPFRLSRVDRRYTTDSFLRCKAHFLRSGPLKSANRVLVWGAGRTGRRISRYLMEGGAQISAFVDIDPNKIGGTARRRPIVAAEDLPSLLDNGSVVLAAVASRGARQLIRDRLCAFGLTEGETFWCVA